MFKGLGYRSVKETKRSNDFGADLVMKMSAFVRPK
ncbi:restriction endonuclease [Salicibibacter cibarius]|uniref:Restriction endonuclease n=1 Tax=Salicibibacter cibarius TaxID=2743000 RepID=A0A7T6Z7T6_9BACI|nr:restriction endonuclease [Salicibibacter cibarius]